MEDIIDSNESDQEEFSVDMDKFRGSLPEELRDVEMIKNAKDITSIAQMAVDNKNMVGQKVEDFIGSIPANGGEPTAIDTVYQKLGWPGADGEYEVIRPDKVDGIDYSEEQEATFLEVAKELKLNNTQVNSLIAMNQKAQEGLLAKNLEEAKAANDALKAEWGSQYDAKKAEVKAILEKYGDESVVELFNEGLGSHAGFVRMIQAAGSGTLETGAVGKGDPPVSNSIAKEDAQKEISRMYMDSDISEALADATHEDHAKYNDKMLILHEVLHGKEVVA